MRWKLAGRDTLDSLGNEGKYRRPEDGTFAILYMLQAPTSTSYFGRVAEERLRRSECLPASCNITVVYRFPIGASKVVEIRKKYPYPKTSLDQVNLDPDGFYTFVMVGLQNKTEALVAKLSKP